MRRGRFNRILSITDKLFLAIVEKSKGWPSFWQNKTLWVIYSDVGNLHSTLSITCRPPPLATLILTLLLVLRWSSVLNRLFLHCTFMLIKHLKTSFTTGNSSPSTLKLIIGLLGPLWQLSRVVNSWLLVLCTSLASCSECSCFWKLFFRAEKVKFSLSEEHWLM